MVLNDAYCTELKVKKGLNEEKQRHDYEIVKQKQELDAQIEKEKIINESNNQYLEGQLKAYKDVIDKFGIDLKNRK